MILNNPTRINFLGCINLILFLIALLQAIFISNQTPRLESTHQQVLIEGFFISLFCFSVMFFCMTLLLLKKYGYIWNSSKTKRPEDWSILTISIISLIVGLQGYPTLVYTSSLPIPSKQEITLMKVISKPYLPSSKSSWCYLKLQNLKNPEIIDRLILNKSNCPEKEFIKATTELKLTTIKQFSRYPLVLKWELIQLSEQSLFEKI